MVWVGLSNLPYISGLIAWLNIGCSKNFKCTGGHYWSWHIGLKEKTIGVDDTFRSD